MEQSFVTEQCLSLDDVRGLLSLVLPEADFATDRTAREAGSGAGNARKAAGVVTGPSLFTQSASLFAKATSFSLANPAQSEANASHFPAKPAHFGKNASPFAPDPALSGANASSFAAALPVP